MEKKNVTLRDMTDDEIQALIGAEDHHLQIIAEQFDTELSYRDTTICIWSQDSEIIRQIEECLEELIVYIQHGKSLTDQNIIYVCREIKNHRKPDLLTLQTKIVGRTLAGKTITAKTSGQLDFIKAMDDHTITFAIGPAGTGKTYLAVIHAVTALKQGEVKRIVLTRPAVEAGENLGFLPGDLKEKVDPYLTPLYDALHVMLGNEKTDLYIEKGIIEIAPLAYMRGRTLDDAFVILDEAQNTTTAQMKMFLTRLGFHSHMVITGDVTQIDLDHRTPSGLLEATSLLKGIDEIAILHLTSDDVVRNPLVQKIIERYDEKSRFQR